MSIWASSTAVDGTHHQPQGRSVTIRPHRQYVALARLMELLASEATDALIHLSEERLHLDGYSSTTRALPGSRSSGASTSVESATMQSAEIDATIAQIHDDITGIASLASSAMTVIRNAKGMRVRREEKPESDVVLCDASKREGCDDEYVPHSRDPRNGWADPSCLMPAARGALCEACYIRERRWRIANGKAMRTDFIAAS